MQQWMWIGCLALALALGGCGGDEESTTSPEGGGAAAAAPAATCRRRADRSSTRSRS